jgi:hypothetical protein
VREKPWIIQLTLERRVGSDGPALLGQKSIVFRMRQMKEKSINGN